jgi:hypothetical protein
LTARITSQHLSILERFENRSSQRILSILLPKGSLSISILHGKVH